MSGEAKKRFNKGKGKGKKSLLEDQSEEPRVNGMGNGTRRGKGHQATASGASLLTKIVFGLLLTSFILVSSVYIVDYKQGHLTKLAATLPPELQSVASKGDTLLRKFAENIKLGLAAAGVKVREAASLVSLGGGQTLDHLLFGESQEAVKEKAAAEKAAAEKAAAEKAAAEKAAAEKAAAEKAAAEKAAAEKAAAEKAAAEKAAAEKAAEEAAIANMKDPIQELFLTSIRAYTQSGGLEHADSNTQAELQSELERVARQFGGTGGDMTLFPEFTFTDPTLDPINISQ